MDPESARSPSTTFDGGSDLDTNLLVSVTSFGWAKNGHCVGNDFNFRTDIPAAHTFISDVLEEYGE